MADWLLTKVIDEQERTPAKPVPVPGDKCSHA
jgi:hypothetical protein